MYSSVRVVEYRHWTSRRSAHFHALTPLGPFRAIIQETKSQWSSGLISRNSFLQLAALVFILAVSTSAQTDWIRTGTGLGVEKVRIAVPDFKSTSSDPANAELLRTFNTTLFN